MSYCFKNNFGRNMHKNAIFLLKIAKTAQGWVLRPQIPLLPAAGGLAPRRPMASGGWELRTQTPPNPFHENSWLRHWAGGRSEVQIPRRIDCTQVAN